MSLGAENKRSNTALGLDSASVKEALTRYNAR